MIIYPCTRAHAGLIDTFHQARDVNSTLDVASAGTRDICLPWLRAATTTCGDSVIEFRAAKCLRRALPTY